jgi:zinc transport system ATP-binding protein
MTIILVTHDVGVLSTFIGRISCLNRYLFSHDDDKVLTKEMLEAAYSCPIELIAHGVPHRVLDDHPQKRKKRGNET